MTWNPRRIQAIPYPSARKIPDEMPTIVAMGVNADSSRAKDGCDSYQECSPNRCSEQPNSVPTIQSAHILLDVDEECCNSEPGHESIAYWMFAPMNAMPHPPASYICDKSLIRFCAIFPFPFPPLSLFGPACGGAERSPSMSYLVAATT